MPPSSYALLGALLAIAISLALGAGWFRQLALVLAGFALVGVFYVHALAAGCPPDAHGCFPDVALLIGGLVLVGWLVGIVLSSMLRRRLARRRELGSGRRA